MKHLFIINPEAGKGKTLDVLPIIKEIFRTRSDEYIVEMTKYQGHATEIVKKYVEDDTFRVYSVGGDGTLNEIINGVVGSNSSVAIVPSGTGNDFVRSIYDADMEDNILKRLIEGEEKLVDLGMVNDRYFINIASVGFDAEVVYNSAAFKKLPMIGGKLAYIMGILITLIKNKSRVFNVEIDGKKHDINSLLIAVANGRKYGGGLLIAPDANITDGEFNVCIVKKISRLKILRFFPKVIKGTHGTVSEVSFHKCKSIKISSNIAFPLNIDGEISIGNNIEFDMIPSQIRIVTPKTERSA